MPNNNKTNPFLSKKLGVISIALRGAEIIYSIIFFRFVSHIGDSNYIYGMSFAERITTIMSFIAPGLAVVISWILACLARSKDKTNAVAKAALITNIVIAVLKILVIIAIVLLFNHMMADCYVNQVGHE